VTEVKNININPAVKMLATETCAISVLQAGSCTVTFPICRMTVRHVCCCWLWIGMCSSRCQRPSRKL